MHAWRRLLPAPLAAAGAHRAGKHFPAQSLRRSKYTLPSPWTAHSPTPVLHARRTQAIPTLQGPLVTDRPRKRPSVQRQQASAGAPAPYHAACTGWCEPPAQSPCLPSSRASRTRSPRTHALPMVSNILKIVPDPATALPHGAGQTASRRAPRDAKHVPGSNSIS